MDEATKRIYVNIRIKKAKEDLLNAKNDLENGYLRGAVNRAYYTIFHVASAVLLWHDVERAKHSGVQSAFGELLIKTGLIEPEYGLIYSRARKLREQQDYDIQALSPEKDTVEMIVEEALKFTYRIETYLSQVGAMGE
jgi:uncharacterized protein (UPF0332 family)